jgi:Mg2+/Co2+ transporter CorB
MMTINRYKLKHLGNNLVNIAAALVAGEIASRYFGEFGAFIATSLGLTFIMLVFAEVTPKTIAALYPEKIAFPSSFLLLPLLLLLTPFVMLVNGFTNGFLAVCCLEIASMTLLALCMLEMHLGFFQKTSLRKRRCYEP